MPEDHPRFHAVVALKKLGHLLLVVIGWVGFVWLWMRVARRPWESEGLVWLIVGSVLVLPVLTGAWVWHNRSIHRRKGERKAVAVVDMGYPRDWHGREVLADWDSLRQSRLVMIQADAHQKRYQGLPAHRHALPQQAAAPVRSAY
jgi:hypothetical protein